MVLGTPPPPQTTSSATAAAAAALNAAAAAAAAAMMPTGGGIVRSLLPHPSSPAVTIEVGLVRAYLHPSMLNYVNRMVKSR